MRKFVPVGLAFGVWFSAILLIGVGGEFAQNDDWSYAEIVRRWVEQGVFSYGNFPATNLLSNVIWGAGFAHLLGATHEALRISTLVAALGGFLAIYAAVRLIACRGTAAMAAVSISVSPLVLFHSFGFMTDVPFLALIAISIWGLSASMAGRGAVFSWIGWAAAVVALLSRQVAFAVPLGFACASVFGGRAKGATLILSVVALIAFAGLQFAYQQWLIATDNMPWAFGIQIGGAMQLLSDPARLVVAVSNLLLQCWLYCGFALAPLMVWIAVRRLAACSTLMGLSVALGLMAATSALSVALLRYGLIMPTWYNTWSSNGFAVSITGVPGDPEVGKVLTIVAAAGAVLLLAAIVDAITFAWIGRAREPGVWRIIVFAVAGGAASLAAVAIAQPSWDRYSICLLPWLALLVARSDRPPPAHAALLSAPAAVVLIAMWSYATAQVYNSMQERRAVVALVASIEATGVPREDINAGWVLDTTSTTRKEDYSNDRSGAVPYFVRQDGVLGEGFEVVMHRPVPRLLLPSQTSPDEAVYRRRP